MKPAFTSNPAKTVLTIATGFLVVYLAAEWEPALYIALVTGLAGVFSNYISRKIEWAWFKLAELLGYVVPNIVLAVFFYGFLFPIALVSRLFRKNDPLFLKSNHSTTFVKRNKVFEAKDLENPW